MLIRLTVGMSGQNSTPLPIWIRMAIFCHHFDLAFRQVLYAMSIDADVPARDRGDTRGGETLFASLTHAYDALEDPAKARLKHLRCVHHWAQSLRNSDSRLATAAEEQISPPVIHPLVRTHPANGRKSLYAGFHASHIDGMNEEKGRA